MLSRQVPRYAAVGLLQVVADSAAFIALTAVGVGTAPANLASRLCGALLGFAMNGRYTFADRDGAWAARRALPRFAAVWIALTLVGTAAVVGIERHASLALTWLLKPLVDALLAALGFLLARHWVYR